MSNTINTNGPFPPFGTLVVNGPATLTGVVIPRPAGSQSGNAVIDVDFYDTNSGDTSGGPVVSVKSANGYQPVTLNASFTKGLYAVQRSPSSIAVTHS